MLASSIAIVIGPTPPGTGVIRAATSATSAVATSPTRPASVRFIPTSTTVAPGFTQSARTISGRPTAAIRTSASRQAAARSRVREWQTVTVALAFTSRLAIGRPTRIERPITTDYGALELDPGAIEDLDHARRGARHESDERLVGLEVERLADADPPLAEVAGVDGRQAVDVLAGGDLGEDGVLIDVRGKGHLDEDPVDLGIAVEAGDERHEVRLGDVAGELVMDRADPGLLARLPLVADVDVRGGVVADEHGRQPRRPSSGGDARRDDAGDPPAQVGGDRLAVENLGCHS